MEFVRGHYECSMRRRPVMDCCDGEQKLLQDRTSNFVHQKFINGNPALKISTPIF